MSRQSRQAADLREREMMSEDSITIKENIFLK